MPAFTRSADIYSMSVEHRQAAIVFLTTGHIPDKNHLQEDGLGSQFKGIFHHCGKGLLVGMVQGCRQKLEAACSHFCGSGGKETCLCPCSPFCPVQDPSPWDVASHINMGLSHSVKPLWKQLHKHSKSCFLMSLNQSSGQWELTITARYGGDERRQTGSYPLWIIPLLGKARSNSNHINSLMLLWYTVNRKLMPSIKMLFKKT